MNSFQKKAFAKLWEQVRAVDPEMKHLISGHRTPAFYSFSCTCGWSATQTRRQNAYARTAKLFAAERGHLLAILGSNATAREHGEL